MPPTTLSSLSYDHGTSEAKLIGETIGAAFDRTVARYPDRDALIVRHQDVRWTWAELGARVDALAAGLLAIGLVPGDRIGIWAPNCSEWTLMQFASAKAGLILVNINPAYRRAELEYALNKVECKALVLAPALKTSDYLAIVQDLAPELASAALETMRLGALPPLEYSRARGPVDATSDQWGPNLGKGALLSESPTLAALGLAGTKMQFTETEVMQSCAKENPEIGRAKAVRLWMGADMNKWPDF